MVGRRCSKAWIEPSWGGCGALRGQVSAEAIVAVFFRWSWGFWGGIGRWIARDCSMRLEMWVVVLYLFRHLYSYFPAFWRF